MICVSFPNFKCNWFTFVSTHHANKTYPAKGKIFIPPFETMFYEKNYVIPSAIKSWNIAQHKLRSL